MSPTTDLVGMSYLGANRPTNGNGRTGTPHEHNGSLSEPAFAKLATREPDEIVPTLVEYAASLRASDLYCYSNENTFEFAIRHLGIVRVLGSIPIEVGRRCLLYVKAMGNMNIGERRKPLEGRWVFPRRASTLLDLRISTIPTLHGEDITLRILDQARAMLSLDQLGMHPQKFSQLGQLLTSPSGLILVAGPTESGKTTSMYAGLAYLNNGFRKINTIEDPIEYSLAGIRQSQVSASADLTFDVLLRGVLRQAPDVIMIGEIRDEETALIAVRAAATGHLVLSTLHAPVAAAAVHSMLRLGVQPRALSHALLGVISQRLVRTLCSECKQPYPLPVGKAFQSVRRWMDPDAGVTLYGPSGCPACYMTGFSGRTGLFEVLMTTGGVRQLMENGATTAAIRRQAVEEGMMEFRHAALLKVADGRTSLEEITRVIPPEYLSAAVE